MWPVVCHVVEPKETRLALRDYHITGGDAGRAHEFEIIIETDAFFG